MNQVGLLKGGIAVANCILIAGGGKLLAIAPPGEFTSWFAGITALFILTSLNFIIKGLIDRVESRLKRAMSITSWTVLAAVSFFLFLFSAYSYYKAFSEKVVIFENNGQIIASLIIGSELTNTGEQLVSKNQDVSAHDMIAIAGGTSEQTVRLLWTTTSINSNKLLLMTYYVFLIVCIGLLLFSAIEIRHGKSASSSSSNA